MITLSGDIGGTSTRMQSTEFTKDGKMQVLKTEHYRNSQFTNFLDIIDAFFAQGSITEDKVNSVCFGVAGPIVKGVVKFTNLPWVINTADIQNKLPAARVELINDFVAIGYGIETLRSQDLCTLQAGLPKENGIKAFIGAGTGLGVGFMTFHDGNYVVHPTEGGHVDFAPTDDLQVELLNYMRKKYHRVSFERLISGPGLVHIYRYMRSNKIFGEEENPELRFLIESEKEIDIAATVAEYAIKHKDILAMRALDVFIRMYGSVAGNLALTTLPYGGLYIVGGIAPKLLPQMKKGKFLEMFSDKGRMSGLLKDVPLHIVTNSDVGLQGTAVFARRLVS
jgi:glucokinase